MTGDTAKPSAHAWEHVLQRDGRRVVILDDDPTGTQNVSDVDVILRPSLPVFRQFMAGGDRAVYVLTNTRAMPEPDAVRLTARIRRDVLTAAEEAGQEAAFILRGDSTLRGHIFAECGVFAGDDAVIMLVPAFPEAGRITRGGVHWLLQDGRYVPVARTEFARDPVFGYTSERMDEWVAEVGGGRHALSVALSGIRERGAAAVCEALLGAPAGAVVVPDAETQSDLEAIALGLLAAEQAGRRITVRAAPAFAALRAGLRPQRAQPSPSSAGAKTLLVCGSHTHASTTQLAALGPGASPLLAPTARIMRGEGAAVAAELAERLRNELRHKGLAIVASERARSPEHGSLQAGAAVMDALTGCVALLRDEVDVVIAKGGITSAQVATDGLLADSARVRGQLTEGVSLWELRLAGGRTLPYAVIPGNIGHERTIAEVVNCWRRRVV